MARPEHERDDAPLDRDTVPGPQDGDVAEVRRRLDEEPEALRRAERERDAPDTDVTPGTDGEPSEPPA